MGNKKKRKCGKCYEDERLCSECNSQLVEAMPMSELQWENTTIDTQNTKPYEINKITPTMEQMIEDGIILSEELSKREFNKLYPNK